MSAQIVPRDDMDDLLPERKKVDLKQRLNEIMRSASTMVVNTEETFHKITALYAESKNWEKQIEFARKQANGPDQERINTRNDKAKELLNPLKEIQQIAKTKSAQYQMMLEELKNKEEERIKQVVDLLGLDEVPHIAPVDKAIRGEGAIVYTRTIRKFRIVDLSKVPLKYLQINEYAIEQDIKLGIAAIDGIDIFDGKVTQLKTR